MKKQFRSLFAAGTAACLLAGCAASQGTAASSAPQPAKQDKDIVVLYTNDVHCAVDSYLGYAGLSAFKKSLEGDNYVELVDSGDSVQGAVMGTLSSGEYIIDIMNEIGYNVAIPGNHEFDYGMDRFFELTKEAQFPYVSCNFTDLSTNELVFPPYVIDTCGTTKIAYVGVSTPHTITSSTPTYFQDDAGEFVYGFDQDSDGSTLYAAVQSAVDAARAEGADYVIALAHLGTIEGFTPYTSSELIAATTGIDAVLDGHSHSVIECERVKNKEGEWTLLTSTGTQLANIGMMVITKEGNISTGLVSDYADKDPDMENYIKSLSADMEETLGEVVAKSDVALTVNDPATGERMVRRAETNMGNFVADAYRASCGADVALENGGGVRNDIAAGDVTYRDIISVQPFGNLLSEVEASGQDILDALEIGARLWPEETGGFLQVSGLDYTINVNVPSSVKLDENGMFVLVDGPYRVHDVTVGSQPLDLTKTYTVVSSAYLLKNGGDGNNVFMDNAIVQEDFIMDNQALINYIKNDLGGTVGEAYADPAGEGRIIEQ